MDRDVSIGDATFVYLRRTKQSDGEYRVYYALQSSYKNYVSIVGGYGWDDE